MVDLLPMHLEYSCNYVNQGSNYHIQMLVPRYLNPLYLTFATIDKTIWY